MKRFANLISQTEIDNLPDIADTSWQNLTLMGYRWLIQEDEPEPGFRAMSWRYDDLDGQNCKRTITESLDIEIEEDMYRKRYAMENLYLIVCDMISYRSGHIKLDSLETATYMSALRDVDNTQYRRMIDAMQFISQALSYYDNKWWDTVVYRDAEDIVAITNALMAQI